MTQSHHDAQPRSFDRVDLRGATFRSCDLSGVVMRAVDIFNAEIDAPWLLERMDAQLVINGVDVVPLIDAELNRRFPGRELRMAATPQDLAGAWAAVETGWQQAVTMAQSLPVEAAETPVDGEWSFTQTLRHLIFATDLWLGRTVLGQDQLHPVGLGHISGDSAGSTPEAVGNSVSPQPTLAEVLPVRAERQQRVREFIAATTGEQLSESRPSPHDPDYHETVHGCLRTIIEEEWEHLRFATRDLRTLRQLPARPEEAR